MRLQADNNSGLHLRSADHRSGTAGCHYTPSGKKQERWTHVLRHKPSPDPTTVRQLTIVWSARHTNPARPSTSSKFRGPASRNPGNVRHGPGPHRGLYETCWVRLEMGRSWEYVDNQQTGAMWGIYTPHIHLLYTVGSERPLICFTSHTHVSSVSSSSA
jgi:hypothetical protein